MSNHIFKGSGVAIVTPMFEDGSVNYEEYGIRILRTREAVADHNLTEFIARIVNAGCIGKDNLGVICIIDGPDVCTGRLRLMRYYGNLHSRDVIDECGLTYIRSSENGYIAAVSCN